MTSVFGFVMILIMFSPFIFWCSIDIHARYRLSRQVKKEHQTEAKLLDSSNKRNSD